MFKDKVKSDIENEQKKKTELMKREKQLKSQIDNLITDSLNLLKTRLSELGIQVPFSKCFFLKFAYSEKATKFCEIFILLLSYEVPVKSKVKISQNFVAFSEYMNFTNITQDIF